MRDERASQLELPVPLHLWFVCPGRNKQMMGLGSLFGEGDLHLLDGDPLKEKQVVDRQVTALWEIL